MSDIDLKSRIYGRICASPPGTVFGVGDFGDFGSPDTVGKVLRRLAAAGDLRRIDRGLYDRPRINKLTGKPAAADYRAVIEAIARRDQAHMLVDGMMAANDLGLSDAVPGRVIIHSDARIKPLRLGNLTITFRPTSASKLYWAGRPAMRIVQALHWLKSKLEHPDDSQRIRRRIQVLLTDAKQGPALRKDLVNGLPSLPAWMQDFLRDLIPIKRSSTSKSAVTKTASKHRKAPAA
ncbi:MAG: DUF6088 family protein [Reyranella sp.]|nr:DUF6088 family protein [Reyranella sp.]